MEDCTLEFGAYRRIGMCFHGHVLAKVMIKFLFIVLVVGVENEDIKGNESGNVFLGGNFVYSTKSQNKFRGRAKHCLQNLTLVAWRMRWILEYLDIIWLP